MGGEGTATTDEQLQVVTKMRKIKLNPTREQKLRLNRFAGAARFTYNEAVAAINQGAKVNKMALRNQLVTEKDNAYFQDASKRWLLETPKVIRQQAVFDAAKSFKAAFSNKRAGNITKFRVGFRSKKRSGGAYVLGVEKQLRAKDGKLAILPTFLGDSIRHFEKLPFQEVPECDCFVRRDRLGNFWLVAPIKVTIQPRGYDNRPVVAIDPGVRKFLTCYATNGDGFCLGKDMVERLMVILQTIDGVDSKLATCTKAADRRRLRRLKLRLYQKYRNVRDDFHWKISRLLADSYGAVLLPHLETQALTEKSRAKTNRQMLAGSHWLFLQRVQQKCLESDTVFVEAHEEYTSKTCGCCGRLNDHLGSSEVFACPCGNVADRDLHAARNILLKHIHKCELPPAISSGIDAYVASHPGLHPAETNADGREALHLM